MPKIYTGFVHGTNFYANKPGSEKEIVNLIARAAESCGHTIELSGPGSQGPKGTPGTFRYSADIFDKGAHRKVSDPERIKFKSKIEHQVIMEGLLHGEAGMRANVRVFVESLKHIDLLPDTINLVGWSRGAVASIMIANALNESYPSINVNLLLLDPVPGDLITRTEDMMTIPENVNNITVINAMDEDRYGFSPLTCSDLEFKSIKTKHAAKQINIPGTHSSVVNLDQETNTGILTGAYVKHHAFYIMKNYGTEFNNEEFEKNTCSQAIINKLEEIFTNEIVVNNMRFENQSYIPTNIERGLELQTFESSSPKQIFTKPSIDEEYLDFMAFEEALNFG
ncbi:MAG: hypothetical protein EP298_10025 [Gammaproteobacteria bacterium]|nr:MAG: hypothetical protein EP298_10025 [Gammaproteobacteria bacterium]UTW41518.1 hypothetical protein KFE69_08350 [bacterium SCSIO 12844]